MTKFSFTRSEVFGWLLLILAWSGCNKDDTTSTFNYAAQAIKDDTLLAQYIRARAISAVKRPAGYYYEVSKSNPDSLQAIAGRTVFLRYKGVLLNDTVFDSNLLNARSFIFEVGAGGVIPGLDSAIRYFHDGDQGRIFIPSRLGYGNVATGKIPASSCLVYELHNLHVE